MIKGWDETLGVGYISITLMGVMVSQMHTYLQIHQVVYIKYIQFFTCQSYLTEVS